MLILTGGGNVTSPMGDAIDLCTLIDQMIVTAPSVLRLSAFEFNTVVILLGRNSTRC